MGSSRFRSVALVVWWRSLHNYVTNPALILPSIMFPLFFFAAFAGGLSNVQNVPGFDFKNGYTAFQFGFVLMQASAFGGVFNGFGIARDFETGFGRRLFLAAPHRSAIVLGYVLNALTRAVMVDALLFVIALAFGMDLSSNALQLVTLFVLALCLNVVAGLWATGVALRFRSIQAGPLMQFPVFMILFMAPVYVPLKLVHGWVHAVASVNPITAIIEAGRSLIAGSPELLGLAFGALAALLVVMLTWALRGLKNAEAAGG